MVGLRLWKRQGTRDTRWNNQSMAWVLMVGLLLGVSANSYSKAAGDKEINQEDPYSTTARRDQAFVKTIRAAMRTLETVDQLDEQEQELVVALVTLTNAAALYETSELPPSKKVSHAIDEAFMSLPFELRKLRQISTIGIGCADEMYQSHVAIQDCSGFNDDTLCRPLLIIGDAETTCTRQAAEAMRSFLP